MGKRDNRYAFINPLSMRSNGPKSCGPTIQDYLNRPRPTWEEVKKKIKEQEKGSNTLSLFEDKINLKYRKALDKRRKKLLRKHQRKQKKRRRTGRLKELSSLDSDSEHERYKKKTRKFKRKKHTKDPASSLSTSSSRLTDSKHFMKTKRRKSSTLEEVDIYTVLHTCG
ncbi:hypothetical protein LSH36_287g05083, partial [Paralvinella palmiformis]